MSAAPGTATKDLRAMSEADLRAQAGKLREEIWHGKLKLRDGAAQQSHQLRQARRQIARILTILKQQSTKTAKERS